MQALFRLLVFLVVPAAAFTTFLIQPLVGKQLIPRYGGTAGTWLTISFFFQSALLAGYALAFHLSGEGRRRAAVLVGGLAVLAALSLRLPPWHFERFPEWPGVLAGLFLSVFPAVLLTTSIGIVLQGWIREQTGVVPYGLYSLSNLGSLFALLGYPFLIEPIYGLARQASALRVLVAVLAVACVVLAWLWQRRGDPGGGPVVPDERLERGQIAGWAVAAFSTCTIMLGAVSLLSAEIGSNPLAWLLPLGLYLLSFTLTFSGLWRPALTSGAFAGFMLALAGYAQAKGLVASELSREPRVWLVLLVTFGSLAGHGFLFDQRPSHRFALFYLVIAGAGMAAGLFASVVAPLVFDRQAELVVGAFVLGAVMLLRLFGTLGWNLRLLVLALSLSPAVLLVGRPLWSEAQQRATRTSYHRNHYGTVILRESPALLTASNETTLHGVQLLGAGLGRTPTAYYTRGTALGMVMEALQQEKAALRIGVIGLGAGTIAAYGREADSIVFWDINPLVHRIATERFTFLRDCPGRVEVRLGDGRRGVRAAGEAFDLLVIDAFSGDYIPAHLLTREALQDYLAKVPGGLMAFHLSNRYVDLWPVIATHAQRLGLGAVWIRATPSSQNEYPDEPARTQYALVFPLARAAQVEAWIQAHNLRPDYDYLVSFADGQRMIDWTDDRHSIAEVLWP